MKFAFAAERYIGGRTIIGKPNEMRCRQCYAQLQEPEQTYNTFWCSTDRKAYCRDCILQKHSIRITHDDIAIDKIEVEK